MILLWRTTSCLWVRLCYFVLLIFLWYARLILKSKCYCSTWLLSCQVQHGPGSHDSWCDDVPSFEANAHGSPQQMVVPINLWTPSLAAARRKILYDRMYAQQWWSYHLTVIQGSAVSFLIRGHVFECVWWPAKPQFISPFPLTVWTATANLLPIPHPFQHGNFLHERGGKNHVCVACNSQLSWSNPCDHWQFLFASD